MTNHGDDCYFYYYSTCTKGDSCPFRHCEAARGNETICNLWQEGRCFRTVCKFRHMEITKKRKEIPCYWENQPAGCQKPHCAFFHEKPRYIEGIFVPADKSHTEEPQHEEPAPPPTPLLPNAANPQLRSVIKTETQEPVPSPTHPPVVINAADDDEDEDDQFSEEGEEGKTGPSPKKFKSGDSPNFGVSTLEEIRLRKALKASMKRAGYPVQNAETPNNREKENIQSFYRPTPSDPTGSLVLEEAERPRSSMAERLGRKIPRADLKTVECVPLKRSLAERLGRVVDEEQPSVPPQKVLRSVKERLGLLTGPGEDALTAETNVVSTKTPEQIRIKTLEEIQQEKATKSLSQNNVPLLVASDVTTTSQTKTTRVIKRALAMKGEETFSEVFQAKKQKLKEEQVQNSRLKKSKQLSENDPEKSQVEPDSFQSHPKPTDVEKVQVKTLDEIRKEKAARLRAEQGEQTDTKKISDTEGNVAKRCRLLRIKKSQTQDNITPEKAAEGTEKPPVAPAPAPETSNNIKVKTFEEIMREKRLRKQEIEEQVKSPAETPSSRNQTVTGFLNRTGSTKTSLKSSQSLQPSSSTPPKVPIRKLMKPEASSVLIRTASDTVKASVPVKQSSPLEPKSQSISTEVTDKNASVLCLQSSDKLIKEPHWAEAAEVLGVPHADESLDNNQSKSPERPDSKVKPKLNVKPSVVKPAVQMKKRGAERSAVAAVKPLSSTTAVQEEPTCRDKKVFPFSNVKAQLISAHPLSPAILLDSGLSSTPLREELQTVPVFTPSQSQEAKPAAIREFCAVPQSPVLKTPTQFKSRRSSAAASRTASTSSTDANTSAMDDFEELINQFTDDHLEEDVDPAIREDDLLQELSEMIDS